MTATPTVAPVLVAVVTGGSGGGGGGASASGASTPSRFVGGLLALLLVVGLGYGLYRRGVGSGLFPGDGGGTRGESELTDADRVERTLAASGGQLELAALAEALEWSASKTSRVLTEMAEDGRVEELGPDGEDVGSLPDGEVAVSLPDDAE